MNSYKAREKQMKILNILFAIVVYMISFAYPSFANQPEFFIKSADTDYIELECSSDNTSVKISYDDELMVTISVNFEIPLNADISTNKLEEYLPESGAWAVASASPGWIYAASDGDNVWFKGVK